MRLFAAAVFPPTVKKTLKTITDSLQSQGVTGNFTLEENLHLTLVFLGETQKQKECISVLEAFSAPAFTLYAQGLGTFSGRGGDILWAGLAKDYGYSTLLSLQKALAQDFSRLGFSKEKRAYRPHITLGRRVHCPPERSTLSQSLQKNPLEIPVTQVQLLRSHRVNGTLTYTPLATKNLQ